MICYFCSMDKGLTVTFTGTGTSHGIPVIACHCDVCSSDDTRDKRLRSSVVVAFDSTVISIDAGPDFRQQMLTNGIEELHAVLLTHEHKDHMAGLDDVRAFNRILGADMPVYCEKRVAEALQREFRYAFSEVKYPGVPAFDVRIIDNETFFVNDEPIIPIRVMHHKLPVLGYRIRNFAYLTDLNHIPRENMALLQGLDVLVIDALRHHSHISHYSLDEALKVIQRLKPVRAYLTHIGHHMVKHAQLSQMLPAGVFAAYDGLVITV